MEADLTTHASAAPGGFLLWVEQPKRVDAVALHGRALAHGIGIASVVGARTVRNVILVDCGQPWSAQVERAVSTLGKLVV